MERAQALIVSILLAASLPCRGEVELPAKTVGAVADAVIPDEDDKKKD